MREIQFRETSADTSAKSNTILTEPKPEVQKTSICTKSREGTAESSGIQDSATLLLTSSKSLLQIRETENYCTQTSQTKSDIKKYTQSV